MNRQISPIAAAVVILVVCAAIGAVWFVKANNHPPPLKPAEALKSPKLREAIGQRFRQVYGSGQH